MIRLLFFGDVFGKAGRQVLFDQIPGLKEELKPDFVVINAENLADGRGLTEKTAKPLFHAGVDAMTGGNHLWDRSESWDFIRANPAIVKPLNFPDTTPGSASITLEKDGKQLTILTLCGQVFMPPCDSPFIAIERWLASNPDYQPCVMLDIHAESTAEKRALGWFVDGRVSAVLGTHTHIQTADEEILTEGTAYITDVGMTGPHDSVIGVKKNIILDKFRHSLPIRYETSDRGLQINAVCVDIDETTGKATSIIRVRRPVELQPAASNAREQE